MSVSTWEMQAGDPTVLAFKLSFLRNPDGVSDRATVEEASSWGSFAIWAGGENLCAHVEQNEVLDSANWYMLPFMEWIAENWDAIFHEEQLPLKNTGISAASALSISRKPPISIKEVDEFQWLDEWTAWWDRHNVRSRREGGLFPDVYLRRYRDSLEISSGAENLIGIPEEFNFLTPYRRYEADLDLAAEAMHAVLSAASAELCRRLPKSHRILRLVERVKLLESPSHQQGRMAWLAGIGLDVSKYTRLASMVNESLSNVDGEILDQITGVNRIKPLVVRGSAYAQLVFGTYSPEITKDDVLTLANLLVKNYVPDATSSLNRLRLPLDLADVKDLTPGEQGGWLGEQACQLLVENSGQSWIDIRKIVSDLGIETDSISLSDEEIRAVSVFGPTQRPKIYCNMETKWGTSSEVRRFTLAHELCHLLLDRNRANELAVASGPWAPLLVEQRANAFAASFLMPAWLLRDSLSALDGDLRDLDTISHLARNLHVSTSSLIDRLHNLGELDGDERFVLKSQWWRKSGKSGV